MRPWLGNTIPMKSAILFLLALAAVSASAGDSFTGRYVEVRTAAVFAGACHYNGEVVTRGQDAILAFRVESGSWGGVDLAGGTAVAIVSSETNLGRPNGQRRSLLVVDSTAGAAQSRALAAALQARYAEALGDVFAVKHAALRFEEKDGAFSVEAPGYARFTVEPLADRACCKMPHLVWYEPLLPLTAKRVGRTVRAESTGATVFAPWSDAGENSAFYGAF
jgi:hypothetical protein